MSISRIAASFFTTSLALVASAVAQEPVAIPAEVETVVSGGAWKSGALNGTLRVIVRTGGFEHIISYAQVDWIVEPQSSNDSGRVVASKVAETGSWRLDRPRFVKAKGAWHLELDAVETHFNPPIRGKWVVRDGPPGQVAAVLVKK